VGDLNTYQQADVEKMHEAQHLIVNTVMPLVDRGVHPLLIVFAMARCMRVLLRKMSVDDQKAVRPAIFHFIAGATEAPANARGGSALWTPDQKH